MPEEQEEYEAIEPEQDGKSMIDILFVFYLCNYCIGKQWFVQC
jgi:hypothetical protein